MNRFFKIFQGNWELVAGDSFGDWPRVYRHKKTGVIRLVIQHDTPQDYLRATNKAFLSAWGVAAAWAFFGWDMLDDAKKSGTPLNPHTVLAVLAVAFVSLFVPLFLTKRKMRRQPKAGRSTDILTIKDGVLRAGGQKVSVSSFHSAPAEPHPKAQRENGDELLARFKEFHWGISKKGYERLYAEASCVRVRAGHLGARVLIAIEFFNDPQHEWAGRAGAAIDYAVKLAKGDIAMPPHDLHMATAATREGWEFERDI